MKINQFVTKWEKWLKKINNVFSWERYGKNVISTYDKLLNL